MKVPGISCTSKNPLNIRFTESALKEDSEEEELCKNVKQVMEIIVELLKDRVDFDKEPATKKQRVQGFFEKQECISIDIMYRELRPELCIYFLSCINKTFYICHITLNISYRIKNINNHVIRA